MPKCFCIIWHLGCGSHLPTILRAFKNHPQIEKCEHLFEMFIMLARRKDAGRVPEFCQGSHGIALQLQRHAGRIPVRYRKAAANSRPAVGTEFSHPYTLLAPYWPLLGPFNKGYVPQARPRAEHHLHTIEGPSKGRDLLGVCGHVHGLPHAH